MSKIGITPTLVQHAVLNLSQQIENSQIDFSYITGIPRGGLIPAVMLYHKLGFSAKQWIAFHELLLYKMPIIVVDEINDTGATLSLISHPNAYTAVTFQKDGSKISADFVGLQMPSEHWHVYFWECDEIPYQNGGIYQIRNIVDNKIYIGKTNSFSQRQSEHFSDLKYNRHSSQYLQNAYNKYGKDVFVFESLLLCTPDQADIYEPCLYEQLDAQYNMTSVFNTGSHLFRKADIINIYKKAIHGISIIDIAKWYNCSRVTIRHIIQGRKYDYINSLSDDLQERLQILREAKLHKQMNKTQLTIDQVRSIKDMLGQQLAPSAIANKMNISVSNIYHIKYGESWEVK